MASSKTSKIMAQDVKAGMRVAHSMEWWQCVAVEIVGGKVFLDLLNPKTDEKTKIECKARHAVWVTGR